VRIKGDERILGDSDFVEAVLREADEQMERRCRLEAERFDLDPVAERVAQVMDVPVELGWEKSRRPQVEDAGSLPCYWASKALGMSMTDLAKRLNLTQRAVSIAVRQGEKIARENQYKLIEGIVIYIFMDVSSLATGSLKVRVMKRIAQEIFHLTLCAKRLL
jgi:hypothetical protein